MAGLSYLELRRTAEARSESSRAHLHDPDGIHPEVPLISLLAVIDPEVVDGGARGRAAGELRLVGRDHLVEVEDDRPPRRTLEDRDVLPEVGSKVAREDLRVHPPGAIGAADDLDLPANGDLEDRLLRSDLN